MEHHQPLSAYRAGDRVQLHPATDLWAMGARYGDVVRVTGQRVHVRLDATGRTVRLEPANILEIVA